MEIKGTIIQVMQIVTGQGKKGPWAKQEFILQTKGEFPKKIAISLWGDDKINKYDLVPNLDVTAFIEIESRNHNDRWYTEVRAYKIEWSSQARKWQPGGEKPKDKPF